jgi:hypothetical protein
MWSNYGLKPIIWSSSSPHEMLVVILPSCNPKILNPHECGTSISLSRDDGLQIQKLSLVQLFLYRMLVAILPLRDAKIELLCSLTALFCMSTLALALFRLLLLCIDSVILSWISILKT